MDSGFSFTGMLDQEEDVTEEVITEVFGSEDAEEEFSSEPSVRDQAIKQMEHANLYRVLLENNIFAPGSARPEIQQLVEGEIKEFIESKLCELLNIGQPKTKTPSVLEGLSEKEALALKLLLSKMTSKMMDVPVKSEPPKPQLNTVSKVPTVTPSLNKQNQQLNTPSVQKVEVKPSNMNAKKTAPKQRKQKNDNLKVSKTAPSKHEELAARQKQINQGTQVKPKNYKSRMPSMAEQMAKIEQDRIALGSPIQDADASYEPLDSEALARHIGYKK